MVVQVLRTKAAISSEINRWTENAYSTGCVSLVLVFLWCRNFCSGTSITDNRPLPDEAHVVFFYFANSYINLKTDLRDIHSCHANFFSRRYNLLVLTFSPVRNCKTARWYRFYATWIQTLPFNPLPHYKTGIWWNLIHFPNKLCLLQQQPSSSSNRRITIAILFSF